MTGAPSPSDVWAKLKYKDDDPNTGEIIAWHPLTAHSADVAAVLEALLTRTILGRRLARLMGWERLTPVHIARLCALAALHDAGKCNHNFQDQAFPNPPRPQGHVQPMVDILEARELQDMLLIPLGVQPMMEWFEGMKDPTHFLLATWGHHGHPVKSRSDASLDLWESRAPSGRDPVSALETLGNEVKSWFPDAYQEDRPFPKQRSRFQHAFNGILTLADWVGSGFPYLEDDMPRGDILDRSRDLAERRLTSSAMIATPSQETLPDDLEFTGILKRHDWTPRPVQVRTLSHTVYPEGGLTILESDTGSGKTEAAIARFFRLYRTGHVDGMYFAVPTRTAAKQLYTRVQNIVNRVYTHSTRTAPPVVQAVPGYLKVDGVEGTPIDRFEVRWHDDQEEDATRERRWAAEGPKRFLAGAIVVGTIDQVLMSTLQVKHAHMRGAALLRHFLVIDEVHASSVYMTHLLSSVLDHHMQAGGHALLMSATLGSESRKRLTIANYNASRDLPSVKEASETGYPFITHVSSMREAPVEKATKPSGYEKRIEMTAEPIAADTPAIALHALRAARQGARVLIIRNLVQDCVEVHEAIREQLSENEEGLLLSVGGRSAPHHSRYADQDRRRLDEAIERAFGKVDDSGNEIPIEGTIAVATQTVQMSLDISSSLLITDLCPVDVLLQRLGRLHRHERTHPGQFQTPRCIVLVPEERDLSTSVVRGSDMRGRGLRGKHGLGTVYKDLRVLEATWRLLEEQREWTIPADNRSLVEKATHPNVLENLVREAQGTSAEEAWELHHEWVIGERMASSQTARHVMLQYDRSFGDQEFGEDLDSVKTRLGQNDVQVEFETSMRSPLSPDDPPSIEALSIPEHLIRRPGGGAVDLEELVAKDVAEGRNGFAFTANGRRFEYTSNGLHVY